MPLAILFWILMLLWLVFGLWFGYVQGQPYPPQRWLPHVLLFVLLSVLGWQVFGAAVK